MGMRDKVVSGLRRNFAGREELEDTVVELRNTARDLQDRIDTSARRIDDLETLTGRLLERIESVERSVGVLRTEDRALANTLSAIDQSVAALQAGRPS